MYNVYNKQSRLQSTDQNTDHSTIQPANQPNRHQSISILGEVLPPADIGLSILLNLLSGIDPSHVVPQLLAASTEIWVSRVPHSQEITKTADLSGWNTWEPMHPSTVKCLSEDTQVNKRKH